MILKIKFFWFFVAVFCLSYQSSYAVSFIPRISLSEEYNDNIYLVSDDQVKSEEWITIVSPGFTIEARTRKAGVSLEYDFSHSTYQTYSDNDSFRHNASFDSWVRLSRHTEVGLSNRFIQTEETLAGEEFAGVRSSRQLYFSNSASADINHRFGENRSINLAYSYNILENEDEAVEDNESHNCSVSLNYSIVPHLGLEIDTSYEKGEYDISPGFVRLVGRTRLVKTFSSTFDIFVEYSHTDFNSDTENNYNLYSWSTGDESTLPSDDLNSEIQRINEDYRIYNPSAGTNLSFGDGGTFSINAGYFIQERDSGENESGLTIDGNLGKQWRFKRGLINITGNSGYEDSRLQSENLGFMTYYQASLEAEYSFTRNIQSTLGASYRYNDYVNSESGQPDRDDQNYNMDVVIRWQAKQWLNSNLAYRYQNRDSNIDQNDYIENSITLSVSLVWDNL